MRKVLFIALIAGLTSLTSCGPSADEKAAEAKRVQVPQTLLMLL